MFRDLIAFQDVHGLSRRSRHASGEPAIFGSQVWAPDRGRFAGKQLANK
jgi:hypothetical protein